MDLIPESYRRYVQQLHILRLWTVVIIVIITLSVSISFSLYYISDQYQAEIVILEGKEAISSQQRSQLQDLQAEHMKLLGKHNVLMKLRGGAAAENMFVAIDRALNGKAVWFTSCRFDRAGSRTREQPKAVNTGYFIILAKEDAAAKKLNEMWKIQTHMEVSGSAIDHETLSSFVHRLLQQPQIGDVRINNTQQHVRADKTVVDFKLIITVNDWYISS